MRARVFAVGSCVCARARVCVKQAAQGVRRGNLSSFRGRESTAPRSPARLRTSVGPSVALSASP